MSKIPDDADDISHLDAHFLLSKKTDLHIHASSDFYDEHYYKGHQIAPALSYLLEPNISLSPDYQQFATYKIKIDKNYSIYIVREGQGIEIDKNCIYGYLYHEKDRQFTAKYALSCISTGGLLYQNSQTYFSDINRDNKPDMIQRLIVTHYAGTDNDLLFAKIWNSSGFIDFDISKIEPELRKRFNIKHHPNP